MTQLFRKPTSDDELPTGAPVNLSRRGFILASAGATAGALVIGFGIPIRPVKAQAAADKIAPGTRVPAFLEIRPDSTARLMSPFMEGGQGIFTGMAQIVGEELDLDPSSFTVENAPAGPDYLIILNGMRITGGSFSTRGGYDTMRHIGASARLMILQASATRLNVPITELTTEPGRVIHAASGRSLSYGEVAADALDLPIPAADSVTLKDKSQFRWIGKDIQRLDIPDKATGRAIYTIDVKVDGMLHAAVQHAPRLGMRVGMIRNEDAVKAMKGVESIHTLPGAVAVVAERWWTAKRAAEALLVEWQEADGTPVIEGARNMPADFSTAAFADRLANEPGDGKDAEVNGDAPGILGSAEDVVSATYHNQYVRHAQLEPPSALARFNDDGSLDLWVPNQMPEVFQADIVKATGLDTAQVNIHSPLLGGFFGRHFLYVAGSPGRQAVQLAKETGRPVKLIWSREEEFLRDTCRPMAAVRFRGALDKDGMPVAIEAVSIGEGATEAIYGHNPDKVDDSAVEGLAAKPYAIPNSRIAQIFVQHPAMLAYWRSVGHSMNDFFYESFLDELADKGGKDPYELRLHLLKDNARQTTLLKAVGELSGGWKRGPFTGEDGRLRARGVAMASPFGSHTAAIAEVSIQFGQIVVHDVWEAIDPGSIVSPAIIDAQLNSAIALGLSQALIEEAIYENGEPVARNYDLYPFLPPDRMPRVHTRIVESGEAMGGVGEPGLPAVAPAVANAVATLTGQRMRSMPFSHYTFES